MIHVLALAGVVSISFSAVFVRLASVSPVTAAFYRALYALPALLVIRAWSMRDDRRLRRERLLGIVSGVVLAIDLALWHESIALLGAGLATVVANVQVVFVMVGGWFLFGERPTPRTLLLAAITFLGVALTSGLARHDAYGLDPARGAAIGVLAGAAYAAFLLVLRGATRSRTPAIGPLFDCTVGALVGALALAAVDPAFTFRPTWPAHGWLVLLALVSQVLGWLLITTVLPMLPTIETSILLLGQPVLAVIWGVVLFAERLSPLQWGGAAVVLGSILISRRPSSTVRSSFAHPAEVPGDEGTAYGRGSIRPPEADGHEAAPADRRSRQPT